MKKVYILYNWDINEIVVISEDRSLVEEYLCDSFMDDVTYQWYWEQLYSNDNPDKIAYAVWTDMLDWYSDYMEILEEEVIS